MAKGVNLVPVRVLDCRGSGSWSGVVAGMDWVVGDADGPSVANLSLGGGANASVDDAVDGHRADRGVMGERPGLRGGHRRDEATQSRQGPFHVQAAGTGVGHGPRGRDADGTALLARLGTGLQQDDVARRPGARVVAGSGGHGGRGCGKGEDGGAGDRCQCPGSAVGHGLLLRGVMWATSSWRADSITGRRTAAQDS
ncbi:MAG TPA: hypothetical protein VLO09_02745 [Ornithinimicrobium sp.]|nr:hypothetical protein [Ornithinimicrobium sp.]